MVKKRYDIFWNLVLLIRPSLKKDTILKSVDPFEMYIEMWVSICKSGIICCNELTPTVFFLKKKLVNMILLVHMPFLYLSFVNWYNFIGK